MKNILDKIGVKGKLQKNFGAIVILALSGSVIFGLPFSDLTITMHIYPHII